MATHWHTVLVESKDTGEEVQVGTYLSQRYRSRDAAADRVAGLLRELTTFSEAAIASARESLISAEDAVRLASWPQAFREFRLTECGDRPCTETVIAFGDELRDRVAALGGRPVVKAPVPPIVH